MSIRDKIQRFFGLEDDQTIDSSMYESDSMSDVGEMRQTRPMQKAQSKVIPITQRQSNSKTNIHVLEPRVFSEAESIAAFLLQNESVLLNFRRMETDQAIKVIDFLAGTIFAINGDLQQVGEGVFLCTPANVDITNLNTEEKREDYYY